MAITKLAVAIADSSAEPNAFVVFRGFEQSIQKAGEMGYDGVELALCSADEVNRATLDAALSKAGLAVSAISSGQVYAKLGQYLTNPDKAGRDAAVHTICGLVRLAESYGKTVNLGRARGFVGEGQTRQEADSLAADCIRRILEVAEKSDVDIIIEPLNRYETNFINTLDECAEFIGKLGSHRVGMMPDTFHMNIEDDKIGASLLRHQKLIKYIHIADSNRRAPGWGHLDFHDVFNAIDAMHFSGWVSVEILPFPDPDSAAKQAVQYVRSHYGQSVAAHRP